MPRYRIDQTIVFSTLKAFFRLDTGFGKAVPLREGEAEIKHLENQNVNLKKRLNTQTKLEAQLREKLETSKTRIGSLERLDPAKQQEHYQRLYGRVRRDKLQQIDRAFTRHKCRSFADFGGVGAASLTGGYTFYTLDRHRPERGVLVDVKPEEIAERARRYPNLDLIKGDFTTPDTLLQVGDVDCVFVFDTLLHQAVPDWNEVLSRYAEYLPNTRVFCIFNPMWTASSKSVRLLDLGIESYRKEAPPAHENLLRAAYETPDESWEGEGRKYRNLLHFWQWGITDHDLMTHMDSLGFDLDYLEERGGWEELPNFSNKAFVFVR